jgi:hypothetical protein
MRGKAISPNSGKQLGYAESHIQDTVRFTRGAPRVRQDSRTN